MIESAKQVLTPLLRADRDKVRTLAGEGDFIEVYCHASVEQCEDRDVKGLYARARAGEIQYFTGISSPYEEPLDAELIVDTGSKPLEDCVHQVLDYLEEHGVITSARQLALHSPKSVSRAVS